MKQKKQQGKRKNERKENGEENPCRSDDRDASERSTETRGRPVLHTDGRISLLSECSVNGTERSGRRRTESVAGKNLIEVFATAR